MDHLKQDIQYALRRLYRSPGFTCVALVTLALGIGANTAIFTVVNGVLLQPLPYPESDRLVGIYHLYNGQRAVMSGPNFTDVASSATLLENAAITSRARVILTGEGEPVRLDAAEVSASLFNVLRVRPQIGRPFAADENTPGRTNVIILSHALWQQRFGGAPDVIGRRIAIDGMSKEVVGVMPAGFSYPAGREAWMPIEYDENFVTKQRGAWQFSAVARLKPGVTPAQSAAEAAAIGRTLARQFPDANANLDITTFPLREAMVGDIRRSVLVLLGAVAFVLLIACANVANLLLARAASRESEMAVRTALGAGRSRLIRQLLTECAILALAGGGLGLLLAVWGVAFLTSLQPQGIPRLDDVRIDGAVIVFTIAIALATGVIFGLAPAVHATQGGLSGALKEGGRGAVTTRGGSRMRGTLVIVEMALAVMLLVGAGLMMRSFMRLQSVDPGFRPEQALTFDLTLPDARYQEDAKRVAFFDRLMPKLRALPGVRAAGAVMGLPLSGMQFNISFKVQGRPPVPPADEPSMEIRVASPEYFATIGIPLKRGRLFTEQDREGSPSVVLITESAARQFFANEDPIGKTITLGWGKRNNGKRSAAGGEVVGIVGDVKDAGLSEPNPPQLYMPLRQWPVSSMSVVLKTATPPTSLTEAVRTQVYDIDPNLPVSNVRTLDQILGRSISQPRFYMLLLAMFAGIALALAAVGIFGVLSYAVSQRTREIGIRMALGAQERSVVRLVVRQAMLLVVSGVAAGLVMATFVSQALAKMLFSVKPTDPATFALVAVVLATVALVASYLPARRATRVDPVVALRAE
ncbi:MAG TPA: ABC transporter permease [Vicinamibacterales bacterium]|nr:ABC transporter permease [Vicinamibacterales bacterium]